jgi:hypothetical protein
MSWFRNKRNPKNPPFTPNQPVPLKENKEQLPNK